MMSGRAAASFMRSCLGVSFSTRTDDFKKPEIIAALKRAFGLGDAAVVVRSDPHYR